VAAGRGARLKRRSKAVPAKMRVFMRVILSRSVRVNL
jgi:hypothetical protein